MHPDIHLRLHVLRAAELRQEAARPAVRPVHRADPVRRPVRVRVGWALVEVGLRLVSSPAGTARWA
ncbi:hypothetical protein [Streptomyces sp. NPDC006368]|uniref:hypothetical protein n=1 Tax=Streptomyces sp. NPDC006368 TaxID=3156760 RepID=UPI0033BC5C9F